MDPVKFYANKREDGPLLPTKNCAGHHGAHMDRSYTQWDLREREKSNKIEQYSSLPFLSIQHIQLCLYKTKALDLLDSKIMTNCSILFIKL